MVIVTRHRLEPTGELDRYKKPILATVDTPFAATAYAPTSAADQPTADALEATLGGTIYFRGAMVDSRPTDEWTVRGVRYGAEGHSEEWRDTHGTLKGSTVLLKREEIARG